MMTSIDLIRRESMQKLALKLSRDEFEALVTCLKQSTDILLDDQTLRILTWDIITKLYAKMLTRLNTLKVAGNSLNINAKEMVSMRVILIGIDFDVYEQTVINEILQLIDKKLK